MPAPSNEKSTGVALLFNTERRPAYTAPRPQTPGDAMEVDTAPGRVQFKSPIVDPSPVPLRQPRKPSPDIEVGPIRKMSPKPSVHKPPKSLSPAQPRLPSSSDLEEFPPTPDVPTSDAAPISDTQDLSDNTEPKWPIAVMPAYLDEDSDVSMGEEDITNQMSQEETLSGNDLEPGKPIPSGNDSLSSSSVQPADAIPTAGSITPEDSIPLGGTIPPGSTTPSSPHILPPNRTTSSAGPLNSYSRMSVRSGKAPVKQSAPTVNVGALVDEDHPFPTPEMPRPGHTYVGGKPGVSMQHERAAQYLDNFIDWSQQITANVGHCQ